MKITTKVGLVGFLLTLASLNLPKAEATTVYKPQNDTSLESRLTRISKVIKQQEGQTEKPLDFSTKNLVGQFLNGRSAWRNGGSAWRNGGSAWRNGGSAWRNGWHNGWHNGWRNGGGGWGNWAPGWRNG